MIDRDGYVVTNWHVIRDADEIRVQLADGRVATPQLVGTDPETELALLRIELPDLPTISLGRSDGLQVGEVVLAIGNSLGLSQTVTMGIVSATGRGNLGVTVFEDFIQTDAAINVGNSGGALVNSRGELVGINTAVISAAPRDLTMPEGIGFAIPVNLVRGVMEQLIAHGRVIRGYLGVDTTDLPELQARALGIDGSAVLLQAVNGPGGGRGAAARRRAHAHQRPADVHAAAGDEPRRELAAGRAHQDPRRARERHDVRDRSRARGAPAARRRLRPARHATLRSLTRLMSAPSRPSFCSMCS